MNENDGLSGADVGWLQARFRSGELSPVDVTRAAFARLDTWEPVINAFCVQDRERSLADARASERRWRAGDVLGDFDGIPVSIKDVVLTRDWPTRKGSRTVAADGPWREDSPVTKRLREQGAVLIGKTTTPEFGWIATGDSPLTGSTRNPWSPAHTSGGSSAGAAASLAAGVTATAIGSDGGGSIRIPAAFCGVVGLKPTFGRVPYWPASIMSVLSHCGPMARSVADAARLLRVIGRPDPDDPWHLPLAACRQPLPFLEGLEGFLIAYSPTLGGLRVDPEIAAAVAAAVDRLEALGADVEVVDAPFESPAADFEVLWKAGAASLLADIPDDLLPLVDPGLRRAGTEGGRYSAVDLVRADQQRLALGRTLGWLHERYDLLVTPTVGVPALKAGATIADPATERDWHDWAGFSYPFNMSRQPALTLPCGRTRDGRPIGIQLVGPLHDDEQVLAVGAALERALPPAGEPPLPLPARLD